MTNEVNSCDYYFTTWPPYDTIPETPYVPYNPYPTSPTPYIPYNPPDVSTKGWECPRCCTINAPWVSTCQGCSGATITTSSIYFTTGEFPHENEF